jgi:hypothetical protein
VELTKQRQRPLVHSAACVSVAHEPVVGRSAVWTVPMSGAPARLLTADSYRSSGISGSPDRKIAGADIPTVNARFTGEVRGIPPRGRPV